MVVEMVNYDEVGLSLKDRLQIKDGEVWPEGCICEPCSDISTCW